MLTGFCNLFFLIVQPVNVYCNLNFQIVAEGFRCVGMCSLVRPVWRNFAPLAYCCSQQFYTLTDLCLYNMPHMLACQSSKHLLNIYQRMTHTAVQSLLRSGSLSAVSSSELTCFWQRDSSSSRLPFVAHPPVMLKMSRSLTGSTCYHRLKTVAHESCSHLSFHRLRHYLPRQLTPSTKTIVDASPLSLQPYLRLIRFDRPIGMAHYFIRWQKSSCNYLMTEIFVEGQSSVWFCLHINI